ncbi:MAG: hypothetical protein B6241_07770 [Spirochaetaceae bacterium 4572_59]|nr:MAG: hypothetical protein B6241_07770 [Spirochaetaceae bacterium 4572_59]
MLLILHLTSAILLVISHGFFLFRSAFLLKKGRAPTLPDRISINLSQLLLPVTILTGLLNLANRTVPFYHMILGISPIIFMFILRKRSFRQSHPLLLPFINGILLAAAFLSGLLLRC